jgi:hypothetical protein
MRSLHDKLSREKVASHEPTAVSKVLAANGNYGAKNQHRVYLRHLVVKNMGKPPIH